MPNDAPADRAEQTAIACGLMEEREAARAALREELRILTEHAKYRTHYEGCERDHPACAAIKRIAAALEALPLREGEACRESINLSHADRSTKDQPDAEAVARAAVEICVEVLAAEQRATSVANQYRGRTTAIGMVLVCAVNQCRTRLNEQIDSIAIQALARAGAERRGGNTNTPKGATNEV